MLCCSRTSSNKYAPEGGHSLGPAGGNRALLGQPMLLLLLLLLLYADLP